MKEIVAIDSADGTCFAILLQEIAVIQKLNQVIDGVETFGFKITLKNGIEFKGGFVKSREKRSENYGELIYSWFERIHN
jgi:hypothetical protein